MQEGCHRPQSTISSSGSAARLTEEYFSAFSEIHHHRVHSEAYSLSADQKDAKIQPAL